MSWRQLALGNPAGCNFSKGGAMSINLRFKTFGKEFNLSGSKERVLSDALAHTGSWPIASLQYSAGWWLVSVSGIETEDPELEEELRGLVVAQLIGHLHDNYDVGNVLADGEDLTARVAVTLAAAGLPARADYQKTNPFPWEQRRVIYLSGRSYQLV